MSTNLADLLASTGGKTAKFTSIGDSITGTVVTAEVRQRTNLDTGKPATWDNGDPQMQIVITLATDERDPADPDDDGHRNVYIKAWGQQMKALREALRVSGATDILPGGTFTATYSADGEKPKPHMSAPKLFQYVYTAPSSTAALLAEANDPTGEVPAQPASPAPTASPRTPDPAEINTAKTLIAAQLDDDTILKTCPTLSPELVAALRNAA